MDALEVLRRQSQLEADRSNFDSLWQDVCEYVMPDLASFTAKRAPGEKRMERVVDSTPIVANTRFAAGMQSLLTPATERWHQLVPVDDGLARDREVRAYCDDVEDRLFAARYLPQAKWGQSIAEACLSIGAVGNAVVAVEDDVGRSIIYTTLHPSECYLIENQWGVVDGMHRKFRLRASQAAERYGEDVLPDEIKTALRQTPDTEFEFVQVIEPVGRYKASGRLPPMFRWGSCTVSCTGKKIVREGGFRRQPFAVARYSTAPGERYGRGPGITALPDIKMLNEMVRTYLRAAHRAVAPPLLAPNDGSLSAFIATPDAVNYGGLGSDGTPRVRPLDSGGRFDLSVELITEIRKRIDSIFNVDLYRVYLDKPPQITATEAMIRAQEKGVLLAPPATRLQADLLGAIIGRELDILDAAGALPPPPRKLLERGGIAALKLQYSAPVNQAQKAGKGIAITTYLGTLQSMAGIDQSVLDGVDLDAAQQELADVYNVPERVLRSQEQIDAIRSTRQQQRAIEQAAATAPPLADAAKNLLEAQRGQGAVPPLLPQAA